MRVVFEGDVSFVVGFTPLPPSIHKSRSIISVPLARLFRIPPPPSTTRRSSLILCSTGAALSTHLRCKTSPLRCRDVNAREMGWRGCENVAWAVTRVHAGKLFLFICSMLPWRIDISHEFTWEKGEEKREEGRKGKGGRKKVTLAWQGGGERFPFPLLARTMATFLTYPVFPCHPSSQETKR